MLIGGNEENDKLWEAYEAKIWNKEDTGRSALESILSKRIEKGKQIISKYASQRSVLFD